MLDSDIKEIVFEGDRSYLIQMGKFDFIVQKSSTHVTNIFEREDGYSKPVDRTDVNELVKQAEELAREEKYTSQNKKKLASD